jgi:sulfur-carrier protein
MNIHLRYFASLREALGAGQAMSVPADMSLSQLRDHLISTSPAHAQALARTRAVRCAMNQVLCPDESAALVEGCEVAFFPPVTGG